jgi:hypothetical protein
MQDNDLSEQLELAQLLVAKGARTADGASPVQCAVVSGWLPLLQACVGESVTGSWLMNVQALASP